MGSKSSKILSSGGLLDSPAPPGYLVGDGSITVLELEGLIGLQKMVINPDTDGINIRRANSYTQNNQSLKLNHSDTDITVRSSDREITKTGLVKHEKQCVVGAKPFDSVVILKTNNTELKSCMRNSVGSTGSSCLSKRVRICEETLEIGGIDRSSFRAAGDSY